MTKLITGLALVLSGIFAGAYVGIWLCFIGGIVQVIEQVKADDIEALQVAMGVARVFFAGVAGWLSAIILIAPGAALIKAS